MAETKYKQTEIGPIPEDWEVVKIGEISSSRMYGVGASAIGYDGRTKYIRITDIDDNCGRFTPNPLTSPQYYLDRHIVREDDLLVARTGASVGKTYLYDKADGRLVFAGFLMKVHIDRGSSKYIFYQTKTNFYKLWVESESARTGQPGINIKQFENFSVPLPPLPEQHAISSALTAIDNLIASLDKLIAKTQSVKQGAMQQLLTGRTRLKGFSEPWKEKKLGEVFNRINGTPITASIMQRIANPAGDIIIYAGGKTIVRAFEKDIPNANVTTKPAVLIQSRGIIDAIYCDKPFTFKNEMWAYTHENPIALIFLSYYLKNNIEYFRVAAARSGMPQISLQDTDEFHIPVVSDSEQQAIVSVLTAIDDQISALEAKRKKYEMVKVGMMQQLLTGKIRLK